MRATLMLAVVVVLAGQATGWAEDVRKVTVKNVEGLDCDDAVRRALRQAIEQAGKVDVFSKTEVENFRLIKDTVVTRAVGKVKDYKVLSRQDGAAGTCVVTVEAAVSKDLLSATWAEVELLCKQLGRPKIMVFFAERIFDRGTTVGRHTGQLDTDSQFQVMIEQRLAEAGFDLVAKEQIDAIKTGKAAEAADKDDLAAMRAIAADFGAHMFITGKANTTGPQVTNVYGGVTLYNWETDVTLRGYWADTAKLLFASGTPDGLRRGGSRVAGRPGAKQALQNTGKRLADVCVEKLLETWTRQATGGGEIVVEIREVDFKHMLAITKAIATIKGIDEVRRDFFKAPIARLQVRSKMAAENLAVAITELTFDGFAVEIQELGLNTITCSVKTAD